MRRPHRRRSKRDDALDEVLELVVQFRERAEHAANRAALTVLKLERDEEERQED